MLLTLKVFTILPSTIDPIITNLCILRRYRYFPSVYDYSNLILWNEKLCEHFGDKEVALSKPYWKPRRNERPQTWLVTWNCNNGIFMQTMHYMYSENIICLHLSDDHNSQFTMQWPISEQTNKLTRTGLIYLHCINQHLSVFYQPTLNSCNIFTIIW